MVARADVLQLLDEQESELKLLRAEGFTFDGKYTTPLMECIYDAAGASRSEAIEGLKKLMIENEEWKTKPNFIELIIEN